MGSGLTTAYNIIQKHNGEIKVKVMGSPIKGELKFPVIATRDIANYAAKRLLALDFEGHHVQDLLGARDVSYHEMA